MSGFVCTFLGDDLVYLGFVFKGMIPVGLTKMIIYYFISDVWQDLKSCPNKL